MVAWRRGARSPGRDRCRRCRGCAPCRRGRSARRRGRGRAAGCRCPGRRRMISTQSSTRRGPHLHRGPRLAVLDGVLDQVAERRHELAAVADATAIAVRRLHGRQRRIVISSCAGQLGDAVDAGADHLGDSRPARPSARLADLDARQLHQVVDRAAGTIGLGDHPRRRRRAIVVEVVSSTSVSASTRQRADGRLQLVARCWRRSRCASARPGGAREMSSTNATLRPCGSGRRRR